MIQVVEKTLGRANRVCNQCKGKYYRNNRDGSNTTAIIKEYGICPAECVGAESGSAKCLYKEMKSSN